MGCVGIDFCSKKNCLEQERCVYNINRHTEWFEEVIKGPKKKKKSKNAPKIELCQKHKEFCTNERACEIFGQCILEHPLVKKDKMALNQFRKPNEFSTIIKVITRLMPSLKRIGQRRFYKRSKK